MIFPHLPFREDPRDALVLHKDFAGSSLDQLPEGSIIGTSSLRRTAQLARKYPNVKVQNIRGNLNTRLRKLDELNVFQGIILATAGLTRMGWHCRTSQIFKDTDLLYAVGQGALAVECRETDDATIELLRPLYSAKTALQIIAERSFLKTLGGGCSAPVAVSSSLTVKDQVHSLSLTGAVWSLDGKEELLETSSTTLSFNGDKCSVCPYNSTKQGECSRVNDIESLCPYKCDREEDRMHKKPKLEENKIPVDLLKKDPHEHCPVQIPIGLDFMGKCPYLESDLVQAGKCPIQGYTKTSFSEAHCPFLTEQAEVALALPSYSSGKNLQTFCGLIPHKDVQIKVFKSSQKLGEELAQSLMDKGATEIMTKAQAEIRSSAA